jgi:hypothetical protein
MAFDISGIVGNAGVQLEQVAYNQFGAAVDQFGRNALGGIFGDQPQDALISPDQYGNTSSGREWNPTSYATDMINYQPKHRFLFRVIFDVSDTAFSDLFGTTADKAKFQYVVKHIDKPTISFEYDNVNYYNFKSKVLKTINHDALALTMVDDISNSFHNFFRAYLSHHSPITRTFKNESGSSIDQLKTSGFSFNDPTSGQAAPNNELDSAIRGVLSNGKSNILKSIRIQQYFGHGMRMNEFIFINPRIIDFNFDEASHEGGDQGNHCSVRFDYDALSIQDSKWIANDKNAAEYNAPGTDMYINPAMAGSNANEETYIGPGSYSVAGTGNNSFIPSPLQSILGSIGSQVIGGAVSKILGGNTNPLFSGITQQVVSKVGNSARNTIYGMTSPNSLESYSQQPQAIKTGDNPNGTVIQDEFGQKWV